MRKMSDIRILIVEDEPLIAADLEEIVSSHNYLCTGIAYSKTDAIDKLSQQNYDLVLLDINLGKIDDGLQLGALINRKYFRPFIFITSYADRQTLDAAKKVRPMGYIVKPFDDRDVYTAIEIGLSNFGEFIKSKELTLDALNNHITYGKVTEREFELIKAMCEGLSNKQLAEKFYVSVNTIKTHIKNIYEKLNVNSRSEVSYLCMQLTGT